MVTRGFFGKKNKNERIPPGQYLENRFPVLSAEPTPKIDIENWTLSISYKSTDLAEISWEQLKSLPEKEITQDIHCVTRWSKLDMKWKGVQISSILKELKIDPPSEWTMIGSSTGYTTNVPLSDLMMKNTIVSYSYEDETISPEHGGPIRLIVPHLYFWKSAKWLNRICLLYTSPSPRD